MRQLDRLRHRLLGEDADGALDHHHRVFGARDDDIHAAILELRVGRIDDQFAVDVADARRRDRPLEGDAGEHERRGRTDDTEDVRVVLLIRAEDGDDHLHLGSVSLREERANRSVRQAGRERRRLGGAAFALDEATGDFAGSVHALFVFDGQREEVEPLARFLLADGGGEDDRIAVLDSDGALRLLGKLAGLHRHRASADFGGDRVYRWICHYVFLLSGASAPV